MSSLTMNKPDLPTTWASEQEIKEKASDAIKYLERKGALDLVEALGLED
jgi:hypothetical protein